MSERLQPQEAINKLVSQMNGLRRTATPPFSVAEPNARRWVLANVDKANRLKAMDILAMIEWYHEGMEKARRANEEIQASQGVKFQGRSFNNFNKGWQDEAFKACLQYAKNFKEAWRSERNSLLLTGSNGTGKTHLAVATMNEIVALGGYSVRFSTYSDLLDSIRRSFKDDDDALRRYTEVDLLVIDDLGQEKYTEWGNEIFFKLINSRYEDQRPTIITTNLSLRDLRTRNKAAFSRMQEAFRVLDMQGKDYRGQI